MTGATHRRRRTNGSLPPASFSYSSFFAKHHQRTEEGTASKDISAQNTPDDPSRVDFSSPLSPPISIRSRPSCCSHPSTYRSCLHLSKRQRQLPSAHRVLLHSFAHSSLISGLGNPSNTLQKTITSLDLAFRGPTVSSSFSSERWHSQARTHLPCWVVVSNSGSFAADRMLVKV